MKNIIELKNEFGFFSYFKNDQVFAEHAKRKQIYEKDIVLDTLKEHILNSNLILDIGAHAGTHTILYKHINKNSTIHCFEPQSKLFELLRYNIEKNNFSNVYLHNKALGHKECNYSMSASSIDGANSGSPIEYGSDKAFNLGGLQVGLGGERINIISIDGLQIKKIDFIKIDAEGFEPLIFEGAQKTIKNQKPVIFFEHNPSYKTINQNVLFDLGLKKEPLDPLCFLKSLNYSLRAIGGNYLAIPIL